MSPQRIDASGAELADAAIVVRDLVKRYDEVLAVDSISFAVRRGTTTALLGGNGAGKTTTLSMLLGVLTPTAGAISVLGFDMLKFRYQVLPRMNFTSPYVDLPKRLTVRENLRVFADLYGVIDPRDRIAELADEFDLTALLKRPYGELSAGQRTLIRRHAYLLLKSWPRLVSMAYYPTVTMILWGFVTIYLRPTNQFLQDAPGFFLGAVLLWDVLFRGQLGVSLTFIEELYARNLGNLFVSPLRYYELIAGQLVMSVLRTLIGVGGACAFAWVLFHYSIFSYGLPLIAFFANLLMFGWAIGLAVSGMVLRWGLGAEELAWAAIFLFAPVSGVYYPIAVLPSLLQAIAYGLPSAYVFEGMRAVLLTQTFRWDLLLRALALNVVYVAIGIALFRIAIAYARKRGMLLQMGE